MNPFASSSRSQAQPFRHAIPPKYKFKGLILRHGAEPEQHDGDYLSPLRGIAAQRLTLRLQFAYPELALAWFAPRLPTGSSRCWTDMA